MAKFEPSGNFEIAGGAIQLGIGAVAAVALAAAVHFLGRLIYLVLLFPVLWGAVVGGLQVIAIKKGKCRSAAVAAVIGLLCGVGSYGVFQVLQNRHTRSAMSEALAGKLKTDGTAVYDAYLEQEFGGKGFAGQLAHRASLGMSISRTGSGGGDKKPMITGVGMYIYWLIEVLIVAGFAAALPAAAAREPFCESCQEWYAKKEVGRVPAESIEKTREALARKDASAIAAGGSAADPACGVLSFDECLKCREANVRVRLESVLKDKRGKVTKKVVHDDMVTRREADAIAAAMTGGGKPTS